jgi:cell division protein FtsX
MKSPQWGDTILAMMFGLAIAAIPFVLWLSFVELGSTHSNSRDATATESDQAADSSDAPWPAVWPWMWALGAVASSTAAVLMLRRFRDDRKPGSPHLLANASGADGRDQRPEVR